MSASRLSSTTIVLGDDVESLSVRYRDDAMGSYAVLDAGAMQFHTSQSSPEFLLRLSAAFAELAEFRRQQDAAAAESRVAA
jgi:hypothetical protein